jgi:hypothetical protein
MNFLKHIFIWIGFACLLGGCQALPAFMNPTPTATPAVPSLSSPHSSASVLTACPVSEQARAMRPAHIPDWDGLGLFACYDITLDLSSSAQYAGTETLVFTNLTGHPLADVIFRTYPNAPVIYGGGMSIGPVSVDNQPVKTEILLADRTALRIILNQPLQPAQTAVIHLVFSLQVPLGIQSNSTYGIFSQSSAGPVFTLANWFPILATRKQDAWQYSVVMPGGDAVTSDSALYKITILTQPGWKIATTGVEISSAEKDGLVRHQFVSGPTRDFMLTASPNFQVRQVQSGDIQINQWGLAEANPGWDQSLDTTCSALEYYQKTFGPYPFKEIDVVAVSLQYASGVEYPGLILITDKAYLPTSRAGLLQVVVAHEIAHQWWYSVVGNDVLRNPWQDEGLTTYSTLAFLRSQHSSIYPVLQRDYQDQVASYERDHPGESIAQPVSAFNGRESAYSTLVYVKAALFFDQLRQRLGDAPFEQALRQYFDENRYRLASPVDLLNLFKSACACDLSDLYRQYGLSAVTP